MTGGLRARHSGESALLCKLHTVRCTTSSYYCEMQCKAPSFCRREKREWLGFNLSRVRQREGHNLPYTHTLCKMFNKVCTMVTVCGRDTTYQTLRPMCKMFNKFAQMQFAVCGRDTTSWEVVGVQIETTVICTNRMCNAHCLVHVVHCAMHTLAFSVHLRWWSLNSSKRPRFVSHSLVEEKLQPT